MPDATLSSKHQLVLPAAVRKELGIKAGDILDIQVEGDQAVIRKAPKSYVQALQQISPVPWKSFTHALHQDREQWDRET